ncbi:MAG: POTRA domain-containing protein, partial [Wenzhouxiangellaceae bacterium]
MVVISRIGCALALALGLAPAALSAQPVITEISGISGDMRANVQASLSLKQAERLEQISVWRLRQMANDARKEVRRAMEPFGFYSASVSVRLSEPDEQGKPWRAQIGIDPGQPVMIQSAEIAISEPASELEAFQEWLANWPLGEGAVLRHRPYEEALSTLEQIAEAHGFFDASFNRRTIRVQPERNEAAINVDYDAGTRYSIGRIDYGDHGFNDDLMRVLTVVEPGQPYLSSELDRQREVLVRTGYFEQIAVE